MQPMEKNVEKQLVVRTFEPDMNALKQTAKQLAHMQDTSLNLYGQAGEVLIVVTARGQANILKPCRRPRKNRACQQAESRLPHTTETAWRQAFYRLAGKRLRACQHIVISRLFRRVPTRRQQRL